MKDEAGYQQELGSFSVEELGLVDSPTPEAFDALTRMALKLFGVPVALISIVQEELDRQFFLSQQGLCEPWNGHRQTPLSHSFCQHVKREGKPLVVSDARLNPMVKGNKAIDELGVVAYLGVPIFLPDGAPIGALCVIGSEVRDWDAEDIANLSELARCVSDEILLRASLGLNEKMHAKILRYTAMRESIAQAFMAPDLSLSARFKELLRTSCSTLGMTSGRIVKLECGQTEPLFEHDPGGQIAVQKCRINLDALTRQVASECQHVHYDDLGALASAGPKRGSTPPGGSYVGAPLIFDGSLYGIIEFFDDNPRKAPWSEEDLSILSVVSMFATAQLGVMRQIAVLENSEKALLSYIAERRNPIPFA